MFPRVEPGYPGYNFHYVARIVCYLLTGTRKPFIIRKPVGHATIIHIKDYFLMTIKSGKFTWENEIVNYNPFRKWIQHLIIYHHRSRLLLCIAQCCSVVRCCAVYFDTSRWLFPSAALALSFNLKPSSCCFSSRRFRSVWRAHDEKYSDGMMPCKLYDASIKINLRQNWIMAIYLRNIN